MTDTTIKIQKGIPIPAQRHALKGKSQYPLDQMKKGDSFYTESNPTYLYALAKTKNIKIACRREGAGHRVWRVS